MSLWFLLSSFTCGTYTSVTASTNHTEKTVFPSLLYLVGVLALLAGKPRGCPPDQMFPGIGDPLLIRRFDEVLRRGAARLHPQPDRIRLVFAANVFLQGLKQLIVSG